jgi:flagellar protein FliO/FliZ
MPFFRRSSRALRPVAAVLAALALMCSLPVPALAASGATGATGTGGTAAAPPAQAKAHKHRQKATKAKAKPAGSTAKSAKSASEGLGEATPLNLSSSEVGKHTSSGGASVVRTVVGLAIVIAVIWGLSWILRQVKAGRDPHVPDGGLKSVAALTLSTGRSVHLVRAGNEYVLLGSAEHGVVPIHRYNEEEAREAGLLPEEDEDDEQPRGPFGSSRLGRLGGGGRSSGDGGGGKSSGGAARMSAQPIAAQLGGGMIARMRAWTVIR